MESASRTMLRRLGSGVRPGAARASSGSSPVSLDRVGFDELVAMARRGSIDSGRSLNIAAGVGPVDARTMELLSAVADAAEAGGFVRVGAVIDGIPDSEGGAAPVRSALIDVPGRLLESFEGESAGRFVGGVEAFVRVPDVEPHALRELLSEEAGRARRSSEGAALLGQRPIENASLIEALRRDDSQGS